MKKLAMTMAAVLLGAGITAFAQPMHGMGRGAEAVSGLEWKLGTMVTTEYKKATGQLVLGQRLDPVFQSEGLEYLLVLPHWSRALVDAKNGDTITLEGTATTVKADTKVQPVFHVFKITVNGKEIDLTRGNDRARGWGSKGKGDRSGRGMMDWGQENDQGPRR